MTLRSALDHLVVVCRDLAQGAAWLRERTGVEPQPGGKHKLMGSHNALLRLGARTYLELLAIDPAAAQPARPRWFGLDDAAAQRRAASAPYLASWVVACGDVARAAQLVPALGEVVPISRGLLALRIAIPASGVPPLGGALPAVVEWENELHPCDALEARGCELAELRVAHSEAGAIRSALAALGFAGPCTVEEGAPSLAARLRTREREILLS